MKIVPENINEAIKHLTPKSEKEVNDALNKEISEWIGNALGGSKYLTESIFEYLIDNDIPVIRENVIHAEDIYPIADEIIIAIFYNYLKKDEKKLAEAIKIALENIKRNV